MSYDSIQDIVRLAESNYLQGNTRMSKYVTFSMHDTLEKIEAYLNSRHISGETDSLGRSKPFFNIVSAAANVWFRATDLDRKDIKFIPQDSASVVLAFVGNVLLQNWMTENAFGQFLNAWGRSLACYGSAICKFVEKDGELIPSIVPWNRFIADPVQFDALPRIEKLYFTPAQLRQNKAYNQEVIDGLIKSKVSRRTLDKMQKDTMNDFIEVYEVHGMIDSRCLEDYPDLSIADDEIKYVQQMHVISYMQTSGDRGDLSYNDYCLYKGREAKDPYVITHLIEQDGRTLAIGAVEYLFDAQWMQNHTIKNMKDTLDIASRLIFQTSDSSFVGRNVLTAIESGDIMIHSLNQPLVRIANDKPDISALQNFGLQWQSLGRELTSTPDALRGNTLPSGTPYALGQLLTNNSTSLFEVMTENKGLALEEILREHVIPHLKKQLRNTDEVVAILDDAGITEIDSIYIPHEAIKRYNQNTKQQILSGQTPQPFDQMGAQAAVKQQTATLGNKRFFVPDDIEKKTWADIFSDFAWERVRVEITNEQSDKMAVLQTLSTVLQTLATNPGALADPNMKLVFNKIISETGAISALQLSTAAAAPSPLPPQPPTGGTPAPAGLPALAAA